VGARVARTHTLPQVTEALGAFNRAMLKEWSPGFLGNWLFVGLASLGSVYAAYVAGHGFGVSVARSNEMQRVKDMLAARDQRDQELLDAVKRVLPVPSPSSAARDAFRY
jgi:hypothetical protein